jgi:hypothetical protein
MQGDYTKERPQEGSPEAVPDQEKLRVTVVSAYVQKSGHPANQNFSTKVVPNSATTWRFDQLSQPSD